MKCRSMILPSPEAVRVMRGRDLLGLGAEWFEAEGRSTMANIEAYTVTYGEASVGDGMRVRAAMMFAFATLLDDVGAKASRPGAHHQDIARADLIVPHLRAGFCPKAPVVLKRGAPQ